MRAPRLTAAAAALCALAAAALAQDVPPPPRLPQVPALPPTQPAPGLSLSDDQVAPDVASLQRQIAQILVQERVPGAAVALVDLKAKEPLMVAGFGLGDPTKAGDVKPSTPFAAGPLSPLFVALTALRVAALEEQSAKMDPHHHEGEEGAGAVQAADGGAPAHVEQTHTEVFQSPLRVPLDATKLGLTNPYALTAPLRLEHLLEQTAGLEDLAPRDLLPAEGFNPALPYVLGLRDRTLRWPPGSRFAPSRASFTAAALQLELWSSSSFAALVEAEVTRPLGLSCSSFRPGPELMEKLAQGHLKGRSVPTRPQLHWPAQGLVTCAADLATLVRLFLERGRSEAGELHGQQLVPGSLIDRMRAGASLSLPPGLTLSGLGTRAAVVDGYLGAGQSGAVEGTSAELLWFAREGVGYAVLLSAESPLALARVSAVSRRFLLRLSGRALPPKPEADPLLAQASGVWTQVAPATELGRPLDELLGFATLSASGDGLSYSFSLGPEQRLLPMGRGALRFEADPTPAAGLVQDPTDAGRTLLVTPDGTFAKAFGPWVFLRLALLGAALLALAASVLFALVWLPRALFGKLKGAPDLRMRGLPPLAALVLGEWLLLWARGSQPLGAPNLTTGLLAGLGIVFAALSLAGLLEALFPKAARLPAPAVSAPGGPAIRVQIEGAPPKRTAAPLPSGPARAVRTFCLTVSLLAVFLACELAAYGLLGVQTWR